MNDSLQTFNESARDAALGIATGFCASERWATALVDGRPYESTDRVFDAARTAWHGVSEHDRLEAFAAHPLIGDREVLRERFADRARAEQGQVLGASDETLDALALGNRAYLDRHGFIFIVCATGQSAAEMLGLLRARIDNDRATEIENASREQAAIMQLRMRQHFELDPS